MYVKRNSQPIRIFNEVELEVSYNYFPAEDAIYRYPDGSGYSGAPATVEINAIWYDGTDIKDIINLSDKLWDQIEIEIIEFETGE